MLLLILNPEETRTGFRIIRLAFNSVNVTAKPYMLVLLCFQIVDFQRILYRDLF